MIPIAAVIAAATAIGLATERRLGDGADRLAGRVMTAMLWVLVPIVVFFNVTTLELSARVGAGIGFAYAALALTLTAAYVLGTHVLRLSRPAVGALMVIAGFANTGYLGLPFAAALFGSHVLSTAIAYDIAVSGLGLVTIGFSIGAAFGSAPGEGLRERVRAFATRNPPLWGAVLGLAAPAALAPDWAVDGSRVIVYALLPLGFFVVGVTLAREADEQKLRFPPPLNRTVATGLALRLVLAPAIVLGLSTAVIAVPDAYLSQAAMASGINGILIAHEYGLDRKLIAAGIAWSTAIVIVAGVMVSLV